jgi:hypothetical protein
MPSWPPSLSMTLISFALICSFTLMFFPMSRLLIFSPPKVDLFAKKRY